MVYFRDDTLDQAHDCTACLLTSQHSRWSEEKAGKIRSCVTCVDTRAFNPFFFYLSIRPFLHREKKTHFYEHLPEQYRKGNLQKYAIEFNHRTK